MAKSKGKKQVKTRSKLLDLPAGTVLSSAKKKKLAKLKKKALSMAYCWYCEREFEDTKVLLAHQKAKHFRCPHCPRRLNTAGGLAVHIDQVHKLGTDRLVHLVCSAPLWLNGLS
jgi:DNA-directed RNA polymerase subunit RPC12/RpoP